MHASFIRLVWWQSACFQNKEPLPLYSLPSVTMSVIINHYQIFAWEHRQVNNEGSMYSLSQLDPLKPSAQSHMQVPSSRVPPFWHDRIQAAWQEARMLNSFIYHDCIFSTVTRDLSIIANYHCHNCLPSKTNDRCVLVQQEYLSAWQLFIIASKQGNMHSLPQVSPL